MRGRPGGRIVTTIAYQGGPLRLADRVESVWDQWTVAGAPSLDDFGITVTPGQQYVWCNDPTTGPCWSARPAAPAGDHLLM